MFRPKRLPPALSRGLGEGLALGLMPAPGLVDLVDILGPWRSGHCSLGKPKPFWRRSAAAEAFAGLSAARRTALVDASADWIRPLSGRRTAGSKTQARLRAAIARARTDTGRRDRCLEASREPPGLVGAAVRGLCGGAETGGGARLDPLAVLCCGDPGACGGALPEADSDHGRHRGDDARCGRGARRAGCGLCPGPALRERRGPPARAGRDERGLPARVYSPRWRIRAAAAVAEDWLASLLGGIEFPGEGHDRPPDGLHHDARQQDQTTTR